MNKIKLIAWNPLDETREVEIKNITVKDTTTLSELFSHIRSDMDLFYLGKYYGRYNYSNSCPYIVSNGKVWWDVPFNEATVWEFCDTFDISNQTIYIEVDCIATGGVTLSLLLYKSWIAFLAFIDNIGRALTAIKIIKFIKRMNSTRSGKAPTFENMELYVSSKEKWELSELCNQTDYPENIMINVLDCLGYEEHDGSYYRNAWKSEQNKKKRETIDYNKYILEYTGFISNLPSYWSEQMSTSLILLYELSHDIDDQKTYNEISNLIEGMINEEGHKEDYSKELHIIDSEIERLERLLPGD